MGGISFTIPRRIAGKARPRLTRRGGKTIVYTPAKTAAAEKEIGWLALAARGDRDLFLGPIELHIRIKRKAGAKDTVGAPVLGKPDCDNSAKLIADALNGILFKDDSQIYLLTVIRRYSTEDQTEVYCEEVNSES